MPAITKTQVTGLAPDITETTLNGTDSLVYSESRGEVLILRNDSGSSISPTIVGADATIVFVSGIGDVDVSGGYAVGAIANGAVKAVRLDAIKSYLAGDVTITSGTGLDAQLLSF